MAFTPSQLRALDWLPSDGSERPRDTFDHEILKGLTTLSSEIREVWIGLHLDRVTPIYRLTPAGIALKAQMERSDG